MLPKQVHAKFDLEVVSFFHDKKFLCRFDCSSFDNRDKTKCHFKGKEYEDRKHLEDVDTSSSCTVGCFCTHNDYDDDKHAKFTCAHIDCPEFFGNPNEERGKTCIKQYEKDGCCAKNTVCGEFK